jgi:hypothetical protein
MTRYPNIQGQSGVIAYEITADSIRIRFRSGDEYLYTYTRPGKVDVERMKTLARQGHGLSTYISQVVKGRFEEKVG